jgi:V/A-type H+-transporting ATPase subunit I
MAIVNVEKMSIIALRRNKKRLIELLQKLGKMEIINVKEKIPKEDWDSFFVPDQGGRDLADIHDKLADIQFALGFINRYSPAKRSIFEEKPIYSEKDMKNISDSQQIWDMVRKCRDLEVRLNELKSEEMKLNNTIELLKPWKGLDVPIQHIKPTDKACIYTGNFPTGSVNNVKEQLSQRAPESYLQVVSTDRDTAFVLLVYLKAAEEQVSAVLKDNSWSKVELPQLEGTPAECIERALLRIKELNQIRQQVADTAHELAKSRRDIEVLYDYYGILSNRTDVEGTIGETTETFYIEGWVSSPDIDAVKTAVLKKVPEAYITVSPPDEDDDVPVVLDNPALVQPFEMITDLYSPPGRNDIDPNKMVAVFFFIFFGMMLGDAGYGVILTIIGLAAIIKMKPTGMAKKLLGLITLGGISTVFWGAMFGGWFGDLIKLKPLWINPLDQPMNLLVLSFILGLIHVYVGLGAAAYKNIKGGQVLDAVFDQGFWFLFLTGLIMFVYPPLLAAAKAISVTGAVGLVLTQGRSKKNIFGKLTSGILSLYGVTGYLSDVLSYSRILALGLASGVIGMVINTMAKMLGFNIIGYVLMIIALLLGHVFNLVINVLGAYVHSSRLQYVEFFGKFYEGGGKAFSPFRQKTRYINLLNEEEI